MKKLSKLKLSQDSELMSDDEMKMIVGGYYGTYNCSSSYEKCNTGTQCVVVDDWGVFVGRCQQSTFGTCGCFS